MDLVVDQWMETHYLVGFVVVLLLLLILLGMRLSQASPRREVTPVPPRLQLQEVEEDHTPEFPPGGPNNASTDVVPRDSSSKTSNGSKDTFPLEYIPTPADISALEKENAQKAAGLWARIGRWDRAARLFAITGLELDAAEAYLGLQQYDKAIPLLTMLFERAPGDEKLRTRLVEALMDTGELARAAELIQAVTFPDSPFPVSAQFLASTGRAYESLGDIDTACHYYQFSLQKNDRQTELPLRLQFLRQVQRLNQLPPEDGAGESPAREFLDRYLRDSTVRRLPNIEGAATNAKPDPGPPLPPGHEIIVGHLAFGFRKREPVHRVASVFSLARRFHIQRLLGQNDKSAVFEARDRVLDYPVALRLVRLPSDMDDFQTLKHRMVSIASLNHPNLAKLTFVDRDGPMLRLATEFLPGGNLREFLTKLGGVGLPLLIKMAMHLASALHSAHLRGVPHGDIRPENILIGTDQRLKLIDFALSPIPVQRLDWEFSNNVHESSETPRLLELMARNEGIQSDILQFGEILDFMLNHARKTIDPIANGGPSPSDELRDLAKRVGKGEFASILRLWQVLEQVFQRTMPSGSAHEGSRSRG